MTNVLTIIRILCAPLILVFPAFSAQFYLLGGITDAVDGTVARKLGTASAFGAKLDTIAAIKAANVIVGFRKFYRFVAVHSVWNKLCGAVVFVIPLFIGCRSAVQTRVSVVIFACIIATIASVLECAYILENHSVE